MFVGGSSGSTAGGIKTTTIAVMLVNIISMFKQRKVLKFLNGELVMKCKNGKLCFNGIFSVDFDCFIDYMSA